MQFPGRHGFCLVGQVQGHSNICAVPKCLIWQVKVLFS